MSLWPTSLWTQVLGPEPRAPSIPSIFTRALSHSFAQMVGFLGPSGMLSVAQKCACLVQMVVVGVTSQNKMFLTSQRDRAAHSASPLINQMVPDIMLPKNRPRGLARPLGRCFWAPGKPVLRTAGGCARA